MWQRQRAVPCVCVSTQAAIVASTQRELKGIRQQLAALYKKIDGASQSAMSRVRMCSPHPGLCLPFKPHFMCPRTRGHPLS